MTRIHKMIREPKSGELACWVDLPPERELLMCAELAERCAKLIADEGCDAMNVSVKIEVQILAAVAKEPKP